MDYRRLRLNRDIDFAGGPSRRYVWAQAYLPHRQCLVRTVLAHRWAFRLYVSTICYLPLRTYHAGNRPSFVGSERRGVIRCHLRPWTTKSHALRHFRGHGPGFCHHLTNLHEYPSSRAMAVCIFCIVTFSGPHYVCWYACDPRWVDS